MFGTIKAALKKLIFTLLRPRWIVEEDGSMGLRLCNVGVNIIYYKWGDPHIGELRWRFAEKREFGETVKSVNFVNGVDVYYIW